MNKGWLELESDPGLFTLLLEDFGVNGVQVEEIYDLQSPITGPVYGFIFLFRWCEERRSRRKTNTEVDSFVTDVEIVNHIFFAQQIIPNSCATHALLSVLLNCDNKVKLGKTLELIKEFTNLMSPEDKGYAIANMPELARVHNSFARPEPRQLPEKQSGLSSVRATESETFHFVSYVPIGGHLFELDGLKPHPIDHGPWEKGEDWTEKFRRVISDRLGMATGGEPYHDIRFNLMTVVPDKRQMMEQKLSTLKTNRNIVMEALQQVMSDSGSDKSDVETAKGKSRETAKKNVTFSSSGLISGSSGMSSPSSSQQSNSSNSSTIPALSSSSPSSSASPSSFSITTVPTSAGPLKLKIISPQPSSILKTTSSSITTLTSTSSSSQSQPSLTATTVSTTASTSSSSSTQDSVEKTVKETQSKEGSSEETEVASTSTNESLPAITTESSSSSSKSEIIKQESISSSTEGADSGAMDTHESEVKEEFMDSSECAPAKTTDKASKDSAVKQEDDSISGEKTVSVSKMKEEAMEEEKDMTTPLRIDTKFTPGLPSAPSSESTDTASEIGSSFSSPGSFINSSCQSSPQFSDGNTTSDGKSEKHEEKSSRSHSDGRRKRRASHSFTPQDLVDLLKNVEHEIESCQQILKEENEKRKKYKIDACRRTHNYDQFIVTFLSMLAEQGHLGTLMEQNMSIKKPTSSTAAVGGKISKKSLLKVSNKKSKGKLKKKGKK